VTRPAYPPLIDYPFILRGVQVIAVHKNNNFMSTLYPQYAS